MPSRSPQPVGKPAIAALPFEAHKMPAHTHDHPHGMHAHPHEHPHGTDAHDESRLLLVAVLTGSFMLAEVAGGLIAGSLALLADAAHMMADFASLALACLAIRLARRPADARRSYGYQRFQVIAAYTNGIALFGVALWITAEAVGRLLRPAEVLAAPMLVVSTLGLVVNIIAFWLLHRGGAANLNMRSAAMHVMGDLLGSLSAIVAALTILHTGWTPIDPILSIVVALLVLRSAWAITSEAAHILLEGAPHGVDAAQVGAAVRTVTGVADVHHVHAWSLDGEQPMLTLHVAIDQHADEQAVLRAVHHVLQERLGVRHATVQPERGVCMHGVLHQQQESGV